MTLMIDACDQYINILNGAFSSVSVEYDVDGYPLKGTYTTSRGVRIIECVWDGEDQVQVIVTNEAGTITYSDNTYQFAIPNLQRAIMVQRVELPARSPDITDLTLDNNNIDENSGLGDVVGNLGAVAGTPPYTFSELLDPDNIFQVVGTELQLSTDTDGRGGTSSDVTIQVTDANLKTFDSLFSVSFNEVPDITDVPLSNDTIPDGSAIGTSIGTLSTVGGTGPFVYTLPVNPTGSLQIVGTDLQIAVMADIVDSPYTGTVRSTDSKGRTFDKPISITVTSAPLSDIVISSTEIENQSPSGTVVGTLAAVGGADPIVFSILSDPSSKFQIVGDDLQMSATAELVDNTYNVTIRATDNTLVTFDKPFVITVTARAITDVTISNTTIPNGSTNGTVGTLTMVGGEGSPTWSIELDPSGVFDIAGNDLVVDNEVLIGNSPYSVTVRATDAESQVFDQPFAVTVTYNNKYSFNPGNTTSGQYMTTPATGLNWSDGQTPFTVAFWVRRTSFQAMTVLSNTSGTGSNTEGLILRADGNLNNRFEWRMNISTGNRIFTRLSSSVSTNTWTHIVFAYDGSETAAGVVMYVDGVATPPDIQTDTLSGPVNNLNDFGIMARNNGNQSSDGNMWIDQFLMINKQLSSLEVTELYNSGSDIDATTLSFFSDIQRSYDFEKTSNDNSPEDEEGLLINSDGTEFVTEVP